MPGVFCYEFMHASWDYSQSSTIYLCPGLSELTKQIGALPELRLAHDDLLQITVQQGRKAVASQGMMEIIGSDEWIHSQYLFL
jgi:hypothetical protein